MPDGQVRPKPNWWESFWEKIGLTPPKEYPGYGQGGWVEAYGQPSKRMPTAPTVQPAGEQPVAEGFDINKGTMIIPGLIQMPNGDLYYIYQDMPYKVDRTFAQSLMNQYNQQLGDGQQVTDGVMANQQAVMRSMARQYAGMEEQISRAKQAQQQTQWELQRQQMLGQLNEPQDWIKRWMLEQRRNPYKPRIPNPEENVRNIKAQITTLGERGPEAMGQWPYFLQEVRQGESPTSSEIVNATIAQREAFESQKANLQRQLAQEQDVLSTWAGPETRARPKTPPTPPWLAQWYPQQLEVGQPIRNLPIATPSMQWWQQQPESARQGWLGFAEYSGGIPMDILSEMQRQLTQPKQPRQRSTARQRTWV